MPSLRMPRLTYANVMSTVAVFIALGGTSFAAVKLSAKSVGERELKTGAVTSQKLKDGTITPADLAPGTATSGPRGPRGAQGPIGVAGPSDAWFSAGLVDSGTLSRTANKATTVARISNLPAGDYVFHGTVSIVAHNIGAVFTYCNIGVNNTGVSTAAVGTFGTAAGSASSGTVTPIGAQGGVRTGADAVLECWNDRDTDPSITPTYQQVGFTAQRVGTLR